MVADADWVRERGPFSRSGGGSAMDRAVWVDPIDPAASISASIGVGLRDRSHDHAALPALLASTCRGASVLDYGR
jgi:hypothetical protein